MKLFRQFCALIVMVYLVLFILFSMWYVHKLNREIKTLKAELAYTDKYLYKKLHNDFVSREDFQEFQQNRREISEHNSK